MNGKLELHPVLVARIESKIDKNGPNGCWMWTGRLSDGYGQANIEFGRTARRMVSHRAVYQLYVALVPEGLQLDHLCRNRACCNPDHLEPVTPAENVHRSSSATQTHCKNGHELTEENVYRETEFRRICRQCRYNKRAAHWKRMKAAQAEAS